MGDDTPNSPSSSSSVNPLDQWVYLTDPESGESYYANTVTRETSWDMPAEVKAVVGDVAPLYVKLPNGWLQFEDDVTGRFYFHHKATGKTVWVMPTEAYPPPVSVRDATLFEEGMRGEAEDEGEEQMEDEDDDEIDEPDELEGESGDDDVTESSRSLLPGATPITSAEAVKLAEKAAKRQARRLKILEEILMSERKYVQSLDALMKVYLVPLRTVADMPSGMSSAKGTKGQIFTHADLDAVFLNADTIHKVNHGFLEELETELKLRQGDWAHVQYGEIIKRAAKQFKGCYTRYVTNYDAAEVHLQRLKDKDQDKHRYLEVCKTHPDAGGLDVRSFLIQPVQRVPRYRMLLEELLQCTDVEHVDEAPLRESLQRVCEVAMHINEEKRHLDEVERMRQLVSRFANSAAIEKELVSYERRLLMEGTLSKIRQAKTQQRSVYLCNDVILYAVRAKGGVSREMQLKGKIWLHDGARVVLEPSTETRPYAFTVIAKGGKGYTWLAENEAAQREWYEAISNAIDDCGANRKNRGGAAKNRSQTLSYVKFKDLETRLKEIKTGSALTKYNVGDGKASLRWVKLSAASNKVVWGDPRSRKCDEAKGQSLDDATALIHGAKSSAFFRKGIKADEDWSCFTIVFKERTLDLAADSLEALIDWYLALASLIPHSTEPLLDEEQLRTRIEGMLR